MFKSYPVNIVKQGKNKSFKIYFKVKNKLISPWHDIPLYNSNNTLNFICEIPKWTRAKMEINKELDYNPIKQDISNGKLREYKWGDMMFNYGAFPQTWENPDIVDNNTKKKGDDDPLDAIEIGSLQLKTGQVIQVKVICILGMIDENETDWKVIVINTKDPLAKKINNITTLKKYQPGILDAIRTWLRNYKTSEGKSKNKFAFKGEYKNKTFANKIIKETHNEWLNKFN
ncbi:Inorganic pyrophosphatase [seawater metagenome]|uniref:inorganic diphosphatase n=1 Tax=seawater metagenome TaxID=1561972 RepID=A0A5E8CJN1_9ZZZZ